MIPNINLIINWFVSDKRGYEYLECIRKNIANDYIAKIYVLCTLDDFKFLCDNVLDYSKLCHIYFNKTDVRPTYRQYFEYMNKISETCDINILSNTDIYFDESIAQVCRYFTNLLQPETVLALTRWDVQNDGTVKQWTNPGSQDTWIWEGKLDLTDMEVNFPLGVWGCDNRLAYELAKKHTVINPANTIRCVHLHLSSFRPIESQPSLHAIPPPHKFITITD